MSNQIVYIETSTTERRTYLGGASLEDHRQLMADGYRHDRMANQYRKTHYVRETYLDGVKVELATNASIDAA